MVTRFQEMGALISAKRKLDGHAVEELQHLLTLVLKFVEMERGSTQLQAIEMMEIQIQEMVALIIASKNLAGIVQEELPLLLTLALRYAEMERN